MMKELSLSKVYQLIEPGPVVLLMTAGNDRANVMVMPWHMMVEFEPPLAAECFANLECKVTDTSLMNKYNLFILEVLKAWIDPESKASKTIHHLDYGTFVVDGETITLKSMMR